MLNRWKKRVWQKIRSASSLSPALRDLLQAKHRTQKAVDELVDCVAELEGQVSQFETLVKEFTA